MDSPFGDWFEAQFPAESGMLASRADEQLTDMIRLGKAAEAEQATRRIRRDQERAALMAWQAAEKLHPACMGGTTLTDEEREDLLMWRTECLRQCGGATDGGDPEAAGRWSGRASRADAMMQRLGGER